MIKFKSLIAALALIMIFSCQSEAKEVKPLFGISKFIYNEADDLLDQSFAEINMNEEAAKAYPNLNKALINYNKEQHDQAMERHRKYREEALTMFQEAPEIARQFYDRVDVIVRRADSTVLSLMEITEDYFGGVHGMYGYFGVNFDSETGKRIYISDVCTNAEALTKAIMTRLHEDSPRSPFGSAEEHIMQQIAEDKLNFTINPDGVSIYFNPYEIGSYAEGLFTATLLFSEYPNLFKSKYYQLPKAYCQTLPTYYPNILSLEAGKRDYIQVDIDDPGAYNVRTGAGTASDSTGLKYIKPPLLVHMTNGKNYLYIDGYIEGVGRRLHVYSISENNLELVWVLPCTFKDMTTIKYETWWIPTDPDNIQFYSSEPIEAGGTPINHIGSIYSDGSFSFG